MCGSGTFPIEAAEIAAGLAPGRARGFAFEDMAGFDPGAWSAMRAGHARPLPEGPPRHFGSDRDQGAVAMAVANAARSGVECSTAFARLAVADIVRPDGQPGLVVANPPYGTRIGDRKPLFGLYAAFGSVLMSRFSGWRVSLVTADAGLARATGLPFGEPGPVVDHGGIGVRLYRTDPL